MGFTCSRREKETCFTNVGILIGNEDDTRALGYREVMSQSPSAHFLAECTKRWVTTVTILLQDFFLPSLYISFLTAKVYPEKMKGSGRVVAPGFVFLPVASVCYLFKGSIS